MLWAATYLVMRLTNWLTIKLLQENDELTTSNLREELEKNNYFFSWATVAQPRQTLG